MTIPGYEWSGNTGLGGDHNVWYRTEGRPIYRSSRALVADRTLPETDVHSTLELIAKLQNEDAIVVAHVGGRYADIKYAHDARLEPSVECIRHGVLLNGSWLTHLSQTTGLGLWHPVTAIKAGRVPNIRVIANLDLMAG